MERDLTLIFAGTAIIKKKGELALEFEKRAREELAKATSSLLCKLPMNFELLSAIASLYLCNLDSFALLAVAICVSTAEEARRVEDRVNALVDLSGPHEVFWTDKSKASVIVRFEDRVEQVKNFFTACKKSLFMINKVMFPLDPRPKTLIALMLKFKNPAAVQRLVRLQLIAGAQMALAVVQAAYPQLNVSVAADTNPTNLLDTYPLIEEAGEKIINKMEASTENELKRRIEQAQRV